MERLILNFPEHIQFTDGELFEFCTINKDLRIERNRFGQIIIIPPTGSLGSSKNTTVSLLLWLWNHQLKLGIAFNSSGGFRLPNGAMRSPNSAWIGSDRWNTLSLAEQENFTPLTPDFVVEVRSSSDSLKEVKDKMLEWLENGCRLAWLIEPVEQRAYVYKPSGLAKTVNAFEESLSGEDVLLGFVLDLALLK